MNGLDKGNFTGHPHISWENPWFSVDFPSKKTVVLFWFSLGDRGWPMLFDQTMKNPPRTSFNLKGPRSLPQDISFQHIHQIILPLNNIPPHVVTPHFHAGPPMEPHFHTIYLPIQYIQCWGSMHPRRPGYHHVILQLVAWVPSTCELSSMGSAD